MFGPPTEFPTDTSSNVRPLPPVPITGTAEFDVPLVGRNVSGLLSENPAFLRLDNESPYLLQVVIGGGTHQLRPGETNVFAADVSTIHVIPVAITSGPASAPSSVLLITAAPDGETIPGTFPTLAPRQVAGFQPINQDYIPADSSAHIKLEPLPPGTLSVLCLHTAGAVTAFKLVGNVTGNDYAIESGGSTSFAASANNAISYLISSYDTALMVTYNAAPGSGTPPNPGLYISALASPTTVDIAPGQLVNVVPVDFNGNDIESFGHTAKFWTGGSSFSNGLLVTQWGSPAAPWQAAGATVIGATAGGIVGFSLILAGGATGTIIPSVLNQIIYLHAINFQYPTGTAGCFGQLQDSSGSSIADFDLSVNIPPTAFPWAGGSRGQSLSIQFKNTSGVAMAKSFQGGIAFSQI
jgi:hypothetical protein